MAHSSEPPRIPSRTDRATREQNQNPTDKTSHKSMSPQATTCKWGQTAQHNDTCTVRVSRPEEAREAMWRWRDPRKKHPKRVKGIPWKAQKADPRKVAGTGKGSVYFQSIWVQGVHGKWGLRGHSGPAPLNSQNTGWDILPPQGRPTDERPGNELKLSRTGTKEIRKEKVQVKEGERKPQVQGLTDFWSLPRSSKENSVKLGKWSWICPLLKVP